MAGESMQAPDGDVNFAPILVPTAPGQILDRITILQIKAGKTLGHSAHSTVLAELNELSKRWQAAVSMSPAIADLEEALRRVNADLWEVEDRLRLYESKSDFGDDFVQAARLVYKLNDERYRLKCRVDVLLRSALSETKVYVAPTAR
jgi:hypothetical protein